MRPLVRFRQHQFAGVLILILATLAFGLAAPDSDAARMILVVLQAATLVAAVLVSQAHPWVIRAAVGISLLLMIGAFVALLGPGEFGDDSARLIALLLVALAPPAIAIAVVREVREEREVSLRTMFGVLCLYLLIGMLFASVLAAFQEVFNAEVISGTPDYPDDYLYFSFATITTTGYGDVVAVSDVGRSLAITEALIGQIYLVTVVALIVGNLAAGRRRHAGPD
jgi:drug/metabolite transporter (DMT)-like permease